MAVPSGYGASQCEYKVFDILLDWKQVTVKCPFGEPAKRDDDP